MSTSPDPESSRATDLGSVGERRRSRERALGLLYEAETKRLPLGDVLDELVIDPEPYAATLVRGVETHSEQIDRLIGEHAQDWALGRMPAIDRAILRLGVCELIANADVPAAVVIDEAVELAKGYSTEDSGRYVNGVLAAIALQVRDGEVTAR